MDNWALALSAVGAGVTLLYLGIRLGMVIASTRSAHHRIDKLEIDLSRNFENFATRLENAIEKAWMNCPLAHKDHHK